MLRDGDEDFPTGSCLGDLTDELPPGQHIVDFISLAPKTYSYITNTGDSVIKLKGFTVNRQVKKVVNFPSLLQLLHGPKDETIAVDYPFNIVRNKRTMEVSCVELSKRLRTTYTKRVVLENFSTLPYGHIDLI